MDKQVIKKVAQEYGLEYPDLKAIIDIETSGKAFDKDGNLFIQFEPHLFSKWLTKFGIEHQYSKTTEGKRTTYFIKANGIEITNGVEVQSKELAAYEKAKQIHEGAAMLSTSFGLGQILGENFQLAGYETARKMIEAFKISEEYQIRAICEFLVRTRIDEYIKLKFWKEVARRYNGPLYYLNEYDKKLEEAHRKAQFETI